MRPNIAVKRIRLSLWILNVYKTQCFFYFKTGKKKLFLIAKLEVSGKGREWKDASIDVIKLNATLFLILNVGCLFKLYVFPILTPHVVVCCMWP